MMSNNLGLGGSLLRSGIKNDTKTLNFGADGIYKTGKPDNRCVHRHKRKT